jgi:single-strand DNA-binding protein
MSLYATGVIRIITDPQLRAFESGSMVCNFAGGIQEGKDKNGNYINNTIDVEVWGKSAELIYDKLKKMDSILASGNIRRQDWNDKNTGEKRSKHVFSISRFEFMPRPPAGGGAATAPDTEDIPF